MEQLIKKGFCTILIAIMFAANIGLFYKTDLVHNCENRLLASFPSFSFSTEWTTQLESYYKDHFTLRNLTTHLASILKRKVFRSSAKPKVVCRGEEGWLYYTSEADKMLGSYTHSNLWSPEVLVQKTRAWEIRKEKLEKLDIQYHMAIWPNKTTIYPEHLSYRLKKQIRNNPSKTDQIITQLHTTNSSIKMLDLRDSFLSRKSEKKLYHKHDSHWNQLGAFYAYQQLMKNMGLEPQGLQDYKLSWNDIKSGDLKDLMGLCNMDSMSESAPTLTLRSGNTKITKQLTKLKATVCYSNENASLDKILMVFRDSYTDAMIPYLVEHFSKIYFVSTDYNEKLVLDIEPDIVVVAKVERRL